MSEDFEFLDEVKDKLLEMAYQLRLIVETIEIMVNDIVHYEATKK